MNASNLNFDMKIFFCANQVSLCIAVALLEREVKRGKRVIFFDGSRCDINVFRNLDINFIHFTRWNFFKFLVGSFFRRPDEVVVPHFRGGRLIKIYAKYARKLAAIDDGLDTFRERPKNIDVSDFKLDTDYYTFDYDVDLASWLSNFNVVKVCKLEGIAKSSKETLNLNDFDVVLVESPSLGLIDLRILKSSKVLLIKHSNPNKNISTFKSYQTIIGAEFALENSIKAYQGTLVIGESMTAVYALQLRSPTFKLLVAVNEGNKKNLITFVELVNKKEFAELLVVKD